MLERLSFFSQSWTRFHPNFCGQFQKLAHAKSLGNGKAKRSPEWPAQKIGSAVERKAPEINQSAVAA